jgi:hypothetical protein
MELSLPLILPLFPSSSILARSREPARVNNFATHDSGIY